AEPLPAGPDGAPGRRGRPERVPRGPGGRVAQPLSRGRAAPRPGARPAVALLLCAAAAALAGCGGPRQATPSADAPPPVPPNLAGAVVMLMPVQDALYAQLPTADGAALDAELAYW